MIKRYEKYTDSGVNWIGEIPSDWNVIRLKHATENFDFMRQPVSGEFRSGMNGKFPYYGATGVIDSVEEYLFDGRYLLIGEDGAPFFESDREVAFVATGKFWVNNHAHILKEHEGYDIRFLKYVLNCVDYRAYITGSTRDKLTQQDLSNILILKASLEEQTQIANYLDRKTSQLDHLIGQKEKLITLLQEKRQAVINEAVTRGLNKNVKLKDSGIGWLGKIPTHWEVKKLKYLLADMKNNIKTGPFGSQLKNDDLDDEGKNKVYTQRSVLDNDFSSGDDLISELKFKDLKEFEVFSGDILLTTRGTIGKAALVPAGIQKGVLHPCLIKVRIDNGKLLNEWFMTYVNESSYFLENVLLESNSTTIQVIYSGTLKEILIPVPPTEEQNEIIDKIKGRLNKMNEAEICLTEQIEKLREYRQSLISEVVTGKVDVRGEAKSKLQ